MNQTNGSGQHTKPAKPVSTALIAGNDSRGKRNKGKNTTINQETRKGPDSRLIQTQPNPTTPDQNGGEGKVREVRHESGGTPGCRKQHEAHAQPAKNQCTELR